MLRRRHVWISPLYFIGLITLLISDRICRESDSLYLPICLGNTIDRKCHYSILSSTSDHLSPLYISLSIIGYVLWWLGGLRGQQFMQIEEDSLLQWQVFFQSLGAIFFTTSLVPTLALQQLFALGSKHVSTTNCKSRRCCGLYHTFARLSISNQLFYERNVRWDLGNFKTATGESSVSLVENLSILSPCILFFQMGMDVTDEI